MNYNFLFSDLKFLDLKIFSENEKWTKKIKFYDILLAEYFKSKWILLFRFIYFGKNKASLLK